MTSKKRSNIIIFGILNIIIGFLIALFAYAVSGSLWLAIPMAILVLILNIRLIKERLKDFPVTVEPSSQSNQEEVTNIFVSKKIGKAIGSFEIQIPLNINYNNLLESFKKKYENSFGKINPKISDINFANITDKLTPGEAYQGEFYPLLNRITTDECRTFLLSKESLMTGPQGLAFLWELAKEKIPNGMYTISLDYNDRVFKENDLALFPFIDHIPDQQDEFELLSEGILWLSDGCIFTIRNKKEEILVNTDFQKVIEDLMIKKQNFTIFLKAPVQGKFEGVAAQAGNKNDKLEIKGSIDTIHFSNEKNNVNVTYTRKYSDLPNSVSEFTLDDIKKIE